MSAEFLFIGQVVCHFGVLSDLDFYGCSMEVGGHNHRKRNGLTPVVQRN